MFHVGQIVECVKTEGPLFPTPVGYVGVTLPLRFRIGDRYTITGVERVSERFDALFFAETAEHTASYPASFFRSVKLDS